MTQFLTGMDGDVDDDSPDKCKLRRRRRIEMRRLAASFSSSSSSAGSVKHLASANNSTSPESSTCASDSKRIKTVDNTGLRGMIPLVSSSDGVDKAAAAEGGVARAEPVYGTMSVPGRSREMEDAVAVKTTLCRPALHRRRPVHFFAVFDGHGGSHVIYNKIFGLRAVLSCSGAYML